MSRAPEEVIDEVLVLAAVDRAVRHRGADGDPPGVLVGQILAPQHAHWCAARAAAGPDMDGGVAAARAAVDRARVILDAPRGSVASDECFEVADGLWRVYRYLGQVSYRLYEWAEPTDERADIDDFLSPGDEKLDPGQRKRREALRQGRRAVWAKHDDSASTFANTG